MNVIWRLLSLCAVFFYSTAVSANDGAYYTSGNQLIPMHETDISITKEFLSLTRNGNLMDVVVNYEFYNPGPAKTMTVGFEALPPEGDADTRPVNGQHRYIHNFTVQMNSKEIDHKVTLNHAEESIRLYVYHFEAEFKSGHNSIKHTYSFDMSGSVMVQYDFDYVLTAANRWAGNNIADFELKIDMGPMAGFQIDNTFFAKANEWELSGAGAAYPMSAYYKHYRDFDKKSAERTTFAIRDGHITLRKKNFTPSGEVYLWAATIGSFGEEFEEISFNSKYHNLPFKISNMMTKRAVDEFSAKVLRNYVFARHGYVFKDVSLQRYFQSMPWYVADPSYKADLEQLTDFEQEWFRERASE